MHGAQSSTVAHGKTRMPVRAACVNCNEGPSAALEQECGWAEAQLRVSTGGDAHMIR